MQEKKKFHVLILSDKDKERLAKVADNARIEIDKAKNPEEKAFVLRILIESFEEVHNAIVPFKNRYSEAPYNYKKGGLE